MTGLVAGEGGTPPTVPEALSEAIADDLNTLALLQDRELAAVTLAGLRDVGFPGNLGFRPRGQASQEAFDLMGRAMAALTGDSAVREWDDIADRLAADFAAIYLNGSLGASPCESVWLSEDHLVCQDAMFEMRELYGHYGLQGPSWRTRSDDHLVLQLQFVAHALRRGRTPDDWRRLARVLDDHLLRWLGAFADRAAARCDTAFYAALVRLTATHVDGLRSVLEIVLGEVRPRPEEVAARCQPRSRQEAVPVAFLPGADGPSW